MAADVGLFVLAVLGATCLRYDLSYFPLRSVRLHFLIGVGAVGLAVLGAAQGLYTGRWRRGASPFE